LADANSSRELHCKRQGEVDVLEPEDRKNANGRKDGRQNYK